MADITRTIAEPRDQPPFEPFPRREWLVTNGLGGYASGTLSGVLTRRYHGLLVASLPSPLGRTVMLDHLLERVRRPGAQPAWLGHEGEIGAESAADRPGHLREFRLDLGLPVWRYAHAGAVIEKRVWMPYRQNTVCVSYSLIGGGDPVRLTLRPFFHVRGYEDALSDSDERCYRVTASDDGYEVTTAGPWPPLRLLIHGTRCALVLEPKGATGVAYQIEAARGYGATGSLSSPGYFRADLVSGTPVTLVASTHAWELLRTEMPETSAARERERRVHLLAAADAGADPVAGELVLAADQFIVTPAGRVESSPQPGTEEEDDERRTVIAGYHWFTDWGRDTMISLEGLTLCTGRHAEARRILQTFARYVRDGLIPNMFPDGAREGLYHTADATLWFFHAAERYRRATGDFDTIRGLLPTFTEIVRRHLEGTRFGIQVDPDDGLLRQGAAGYQLTWMDAKVDDWVVTPRRGKAVEINALWYNALCLLAGWLRADHAPAGAPALERHAERACESFNARFWSEDLGHLFDVIDTEGGGDDPACRPNQVFAISLDHPVLSRDRWAAVLNVTADRLLTPVGLRSLSREHPDYKPHYEGDLRTRDAAYHQGTVWAWLIGPFVDAWMKLHPDDGGGARQMLRGFEQHLGDACVGTVSEIFDAEEPFAPRGCVSQAWSVAEVLRCLRKPAIAAQYHRS